MGLVQDKVVIVSGAAANIGEACAHMLAREGAHVVLADRNLDGGARVAEAIRAEGGDAVALPNDLADESAVSTLIARVVDLHGRVDVLHNNAALTAPEQMAADAWIADMTADVWDAAFRVNTRGAMLMTKYALPHMIAAGGGSIINTSSVVSMLGDVFNPAYSASKSAVNALTRNTAAQYGRQNIRCNAVLPGLVLSPRAREIMTTEQVDTVERHRLLPRSCKPEDIAGAVLWLASDLSAFVTGQLIAVDGGVAQHVPYYADVMRQ